MTAALMISDGICAPRIAYPSLRRMRAPWTRMVGLIGKRRIDPQRAYLFDYCSAVHTCFMSVSIDVIVCDRDLCVLHVETMRPWRMSSKRLRKARAVIEAAAGSAAELGIKPGCVLLIKP